LGVIYLQVATEHPCPRAVFNVVAKRTDFCQHCQCRCGSRERYFGEGQCPPKPRCRSRAKCPAPMARESVWRALPTPPRIFFSRTAPALTMLVKRTVVKCFLPTRLEWGGVGPYGLQNLQKRQLAVTQSHSKRYR